jgi:hypothetical protein
MKSLIAVAAAMLIAGSASVAHGGGKIHTSLETVKSSSTRTVPDVTYPFTFTCQHCGMTITVKSKSDWLKSCEQCACGESNLGCYKSSTK